MSSTKPAEVFERQQYNKHTKESYSKEGYFVHYLIIVISLVLSIDTFLPSR